MSFKRPTTTTKKKQYTFTYSKCKTENLLDFKMIYKYQILKFINDV